MHINIEEIEQNKPKKKKWIVLTFAFCLIYIIVIGYLDFEIISPLILHEDYCYYHNHDSPLWVDLFYLNGDGHPDGTFLHLNLLILFCIILGYFTKRLFIGIVQLEWTK